MGFELYILINFSAQVIHYDTSTIAWTVIHQFIVVAVLVIVGFVAGLIKPDIFLLIGTSFAGAFDLVNGVGSLTQQFPFQLSTINAPAYAWWIYFGVFIVVWAAGLTYQSMVYQKMNLDTLKKFGSYKKDYGD